MKAHDQIGTHWEGCETSHPECALARLSDTRAAATLAARALAMVGTWHALCPSFNSFGDACACGIEERRAAIRALKEAGVGCD